MANLLRVNKSLKTPFSIENKMIRKNSYFIGLIVLMLFSVQGVLALEETVFIDDYEVLFSYHGAEEGDEFSLSVTIKNMGNKEKEDVLFEIDADDPFDVDSDDEWFVGNILEDEEETKTFRIDVDSDVSEGEYDLEFTLEDSEDDYNEEVEIEVESDNADLIIGDIVSSPLILMPDLEDVKLEITLENLGGGDATFVRGRLILPEGLSPSSSYSDSVSLGSIGSKDNKVATFFVDIDEEIKSDVLTGTLELEYKSDVKDMKSSLNFDLPVKGRPQFDIVSSYTEGNIVSEGNGKLRVNVQNIGEEKGEEVSVRVFENSDHPFDFDEKTNFIGNLDKGEAGVAIFSFDVDSGADSNEYVVKVQIRAINRGNVLVSEDSLSIRVAEAKKRNYSFMVLIILPIVLMIVLVMLIRRDRRVEYTRGEKDL